MSKQRIINEIPPAAVVREQLGDALREVAILRRMLRLAEKAEERRNTRPANKQVSESEAAHA